MKVRFGVIGSSCRIWTNHATRNWLSDPKVLGSWDPAVGAIYTAYNKSRSEINFLFLLLLSSRSVKHFEPPFSCPELLNAKELNRHVLQARCIHGPEQYLAICSRVQKIDLRQQSCTQHEHAAARPYACKHCEIGFLLTTPERKGIYSNPFTGILSSCVRTIFATFLPNSQTSNSATCFLQARATIRLQTLRDWFFYSPLLNATEFIQTLLRASFTHVPEHYSIKNFVVRPAARSETTPESVHSNASNAAMQFFVTAVSSIHTGERPYACKQRGNAFFYRHTFKQAQ